jgi:cold shock CspA family protein
MQTGIVVFFLPEKGYGYIRVPETREEFFVRREDCEDLIGKGDRVAFEVRESKWGIRAIQVSVLKKEG